jgi:hypothetical protein
VVGAVVVDGEVVVNGLKASVDWDVLPPVV